MSEDDVVEDFEYYLQSKMDEVKKPTTKMKKSELKEMIKAAFLSEADFTSGQDDDAAPAIASMYDPLYEAEEESLDDILARIAGTKADPYMAEDLSEAEEEEEIDIDVDAEEKTEKPANDSIVVDKRIVSLSSLPSDTRKILDSLESLRAQAEEFGDQKFITQVGNTITFFTRDFVVAGDEPTKAKVDESLEMIRMRKIAGLLTEGEYSKALLREVEEVSLESAVNQAIKLLPKLEKSSEFNKLASQIVQDPKLMQQLEKALAQGGIMMNEELKQLDSNDMRTLALNLAKKAEITNEGMSNNPDADDVSAGFSMLAFGGGGTLAAYFSSAIGAAIPATTTLFAGPAVLGAIAGVALFYLARKVYLLMNPDL
jgi:hypothetical protein